MEKVLPHGRILRAPSLFKAKLALQHFEISLVVLDLMLPDGCGLDLVSEITARYPRAGIIILTASAEEETRQLALAFGVTHYLEKPFHAAALERVLGECIETAVPKEEEQSFKASLDDLSVTDILQLKCLSRATTRLIVFESDGRFGSISLEEGEVKHAETEDCSGRREAKMGVEALREILAWRGGKIEEVEKPPSQNTIDQPWQGLLLEATQELEETETQFATN